MEQYTSANAEDVDMVYDAGIESNKPSGMFRFGKAIASAFNSANLWQGLNGVWKEREKENQAKPDRDILKAKAEQKYAELKKSGYKGTQTAPTRPESQEVPEIKHRDTDESRHSSFRDSGVYVDELQSSSDRRGSDKFITSTESLMPPPPMTAGHRSASPFSDASSGRRSSFLFQKPSLEGLKRIKSQVHLPSIKRSAENATSLPSTEKGGAAGPGLRREGSRLDTAIQYKLIKKVSDLENKLEIARRELEQSIHRAPPVPDLPERVGRKQFVPGALPSLPSERLLTPQAQGNDDITDGRHVRTATTVDRSSATISTEDKDHTLAEHNTKAEDEYGEAAKQALWNKRASEIATRNAAARQSRKLSADIKSDDVMESEPAKDSVSKKRSGGRRKSQEQNFSGSFGSSGVQKRPLKLYVKNPRNAPVTNEEEVPPLPVKRTVFDPIKVDQAQIMAMRAIPDTHVPFGKAWDDMKNLRKVYPDATEAELVTYVSRQSAPKKLTDHTSVSHVDRPSSPFLGRPGSTSPMKTRARASRHGISPPPPSLSSAKKFHRNLEGVTSPTPANRKSHNAENEEAHSSAKKEPLRTSEESAKAARASLDKPLPDVKTDTDEFEWDDDVF